MCAIVLIKMKFIEATSEKKIIRCFQIKYLYFWWNKAYAKHNASLNLCYEL